MHIIIGLGNPGKKYENTRHNVGFMALDALAEKIGGGWKTNKKFQAQICQRGNTILVKPQTFMNNSGQSVRAVLAYYKLLPKKLGVFKVKDSDLSEILTVIHDDIDINLGKYKISIDSRSAGHKGVESIINHLKTKNFKRIRIGIRTEMAIRVPADLPRRNEMEAGKFVLEKFKKEELEIIKKLITELAL
ncbi:MAG: aminoacyl-tRNA hydrolase [Patescibacteria group bacterium]|nr:aminoacyl-tRNA hydrolase [Patescibacteria group bacterium]MDD5295072.1 aminoacyl-tRNA hydrolase [Patescibacteria group bacterium]MDD5554704.1 aminoacyl-tRNA hydrolase [Patescibacteria group bacterium]